jgi:hypothetical protein
MNKKQKELLEFSLVVMAGAVIFPPWDTSKGTVWRFLFDPPRSAEIAIGPLALTLLLISIVAGAVWSSLGSVKSGGSDVPQSEQDRKGL